MIEKFQNWFHENSITEVECLVPDLGGIARGKILPTNKFLKGLEDESHRLPQSTLFKQYQEIMLLRTLPVLYQEVFTIQLTLM